VAFGQRPELNTGFSTSFCCPALDKFDFASGAVVQRYVFEIEDRGKKRPEKHRAGAAGHGGAAASSALNAAFGAAKAVAARRNAS
jgi:hypothetical protein